MAAKEGERLIAAWCPPEFVESVDAVASAAGVSRSTLLRQAVVDQMLSLAVTPPASPSTD